VIAYALRRLVWGVFLVLIMTWASFILFFVIPPNHVAAGQGRDTIQVTISQAMGIDKAPLPVQWAEYIWNAVRHQSLGTSIQTHTPVSETLASAIPVTASLLLGGTLLFLLISIPVGIISALRPRTLLDRTLMILVFIGIAAHPAWIGLILSYTLGYRLHVTPIGGYCDAVNPVTSCGGVLQWSYHLLLPWLSFAVLFAALYARMIRASVIESSQEDYVLAARAKGGSGLHVLRVHVLRNAAIPVVMMLGMDLGLAFAGTLFVEQVFSLQGMGYTLVTALQQQDFPVVLGIVMVVSAAIAVFTLIADLCYAALDPRVRLAAPKRRRPRLPTRRKRGRPAHATLLGPEPQSQRSTASS
jgi:peptide/nickel transport system permease protein